MKNKLKKYILILLPLLLNCCSLDRDNLLDPKNPNSNADQVVLVELFVNDNTGYEFCNTALETIEDILECLIGKKAYFRIEAEKRIEGNSIDLDVKVARLGSWKRENLNLKAVLYEDMGTHLHRFVVRKIFQHQAINAMKPGEVKSFSFAGQLSNVQNSNAIYALVFVQDQDETTMEIYQAAKFK